MKLTCDRCHANFEGFKTEHFTAGYYEMDAWSDFRQSPEEQKVCDECMFKNPKYIEIYGIHYLGSINGHI